MAENEYAMADEDWEILMEALRYMMDERGLSEPQDAFALLKEHWYIYNDMDAVQAYVDGKRAEKKAAHKAQLEAQLAALESE